MKESQAVAVIKRLYTDWRSPWEAGDASGVSDFYTDDAIQMPAGASDIVGRDTFRVSLESLFKQFVVKGDSTEVLEVETAGDLAFVRGTYALTLIPKAGGEPTRYTGKFVHLLKRQPNGSWKIHRAIGVDDVSPPSTSES